MAGAELRAARRAGRLRTAVMSTLAVVAIVGASIIGANDWADAHTVNSAHGSQGGEHRTL